MKKYFLIKFLFFSFFYSIICCINVTTADEEIKRITSPDDTVDAVLVRRGGGATTSFSYQIYIVPKGAKISKGKEIFRADHVNKLNIKWKEVKLLLILYEEARIFHFKNFWHSKEVMNYEYVVEIQLKPLKTGFVLSDRDRYNHK